MPLRRTLLTALTLALFGTTPLVAQQKDPFAEWEREHSRMRTKSPAEVSPVQRVDVADEKSTMTYFSPSASSDAATGADENKTAKPVATVPMREKTASPVTSSQSADKKPTPPSRGQISTVGFNPDEENRPKAGRIRNAAFTPEFDSGSKRSIEPLAGDVGGGNGDEFQDFINAAAAGKRQGAAAIDSFDDSNPGIASPLFDPKPASPAKEPSARAMPSTTPPGAFNGPQSPGVTVQWIKHGGFNVGQECSVELVVKNTSPTVVRSVVTEAVIPDTVQLVEAQPTAVEGSDMPTWAFGELQPGQSRSVMLKVIPQSQGDVRMEAYVRLTGSTSSQFSVQEPMIGVAVNGPEKVEIGQQVGYVVRVSNPGTGVANNVVIQAAVPEGLEHRNGSLLTIEIGTLNPGESRQARLSLTAVQGGDQQLAVRVLADGGLSDQTTTAIMIAEPKLAIALAGPKAPVAGRSENYTLTVSNSGNVQSANVRAKYRIPDGFKFLSADRGGKYVEIDQAVEWFVGTLQPNDSSEFVVVMIANETGELVHQAGVISEHGQITTCDLLSNVTGSAALEIKVAAAPREIRVGEEVRWEIQVRNTGSREASNVGVSCELPAGFELIKADGPTDHIAENGVLVFRSIPSIDAETVENIVIHGRCTREGNQRLRLRVASESINEVLIGEEFTSVSR